jgi:transcriptional regulator GlxA family with amidase domain
VRDLPDRFPEIKVEEDRIFIVDESVWTSARTSAGLDLALGMIENAW